MMQTLNRQQCSASSWRGRPHQPYGPGGFNRCVLPDDGHTMHEDGFGQTFRTEPHKVVRR